jgi:hypothetical protein
VNSSAAARELVGEEARMASTQVQLPERAAAAARSRYVCRSDMAPAAAPRQARRAGLVPGSAEPVAMPISETTTSWSVMRSSSSSTGEATDSWNATFSSEHNATHLATCWTRRTASLRGLLRECGASQSMRWVGTEWEKCGYL